MGRSLDLKTKRATQRLSAVSGTAGAIATAPPVRLSDDGAQDDRGSTH